MHKVCEVRRSESCKSGSSDILECGYEDIGFMSAPLASFDTFDLSDDDLGCIGDRRGCKVKHAMIHGQELIQEVIHDEQVSGSSPTAGVVELVYDSDTRDALACMYDMPGSVIESKLVEANIPNDLIVNKNCSTACETQKQSPSKKYKFNLKSKKALPKKSKEKRVVFGIFSRNKNKTPVESGVQNTDNNLDDAQNKVIEQENVVPIEECSVELCVEPVNDKSQRETVCEGGDCEDELVNEHSNNIQQSFDSDTSSDETGTEYSETIHGRKVRIHVYGQLSKPSTVSDNLREIVPDDSESDDVNSRSVSIRCPEWDVDAEETHLEEIDPNTLYGSKKKAYLKKLERLQVKTMSLVRPRSSTPLCVTSLSEYRDIQPPNLSESAEKIQIMLPTDTVHHHKTSGVKPSGSPEGFNEQCLFAHTKSAFIYSSDLSLSATPRRVLLSPGLAACNATSPNIVLAPPFSKSDNPAPGPENIFQFPSVTRPQATSKWIQFDGNIESDDIDAQFPADKTNKPSINIEQSGDILTVTLETRGESTETYHSEVEDTEGADESSNTNTDFNFSDSEVD